MAIPVKLEVFEGPLDLLLHLIEKNKIDIYDIPIVEITDQYMEYIQAMETRDMGVMSEFMVMAATLLDIKCRMLLPKDVNEDGEEEDPREELVQKLLEYKMYKYMSYELRDRMEDAKGSYFRTRHLPPEVAKFQIIPTPEELLEGLTLARLQKLFEAIMRRQEERIDPIRSRFGRIEREEISVSDRLVELRDFAKQRRSFTFSELIRGAQSRTRMVVSFLSVLELIKMGHISVRQDALFEDIDIEVLDDPETWTYEFETEDDANNEWSY